MARILVVDDDSHIREIVTFALQKAGHEVTEAENGTQALATFGQQAFDLAVLDIVMPEDDGLELCRNIRKVSDMPIIFVSSRDEELDRIVGLELGADDYLTKPFSPRELSARVSAILRRTGRGSSSSRDSQPPMVEQPSVLETAACPSPPPESRLVHGPLALDPVSHRFYTSEHEVTLTVTEFGLMKVLLESPGRVFSRAQLVEQAYGAGHYITDRTVDSHIRRVRRKLGPHADLLETVYGVGYRLKE